MKPSPYDSQVYTKAILALAGKAIKSMVVKPVTLPAVCLAVFYTIFSLLVLICY